MYSLGDRLVTVAQAMHALWAVRGGANGRFSVSVGSGCARP
jgi:hypothetical protein